VHQPLLFEALLDAFLFALLNEAFGESAHLCCLPRAVLGDKSEHGSTHRRCTGLGYRSGGKRRCVVLTNRPLSRLMRHDKKT
jgi:hypothetical protein